MKTRAEERMRYLYQAEQVACRYLRDLGYTHIGHGFGGISEEADGELVATMHYSACPGPDVTHETPLQDLIIRVRITDIGRQKQFRPALVTTA